MNNRANRKLIAEDTLAILEKGYYISKTGKRIDIKQIQSKAESETVVYSPQDSDDLLEKNTFTQLSTPTKVRVIHQTTLDATRTLIEEGYRDVLCLNFASARNPGGGFLGGSQAQEESIARSTGLYRCQLKASAYYETNRAIKSCVYTDYMIYSPNVPIIKDEEGNTLNELQYCGIITAPAVNLGVVKRQEPDKVNDVEAIMKRRIRKVLSIALFHKHRAVVLGAWGCGVFQNDPVDIARYFKEIIVEEFDDRFKEIVFAIYARDEKFIRPFQEYFC